MLEKLRTPTRGSNAYRHSSIVDRTPLTITYVVDDAEHASRIARNLCSVEDEFLLAALMSLPKHGIAAVNTRFTRALRSNRAAAVACVIDDPDGGIWAQRELGVPLEIVEIEVDSPSWKRGFASAQRWVGYAPRAVRSRGPISTFELTEAVHYGIGVVTDAGERIIEPGPFCPERWSSARWRFAELIYGQFRTLTSGR